MFVCCIVHLSPILAMFKTLLLRGLEMKHHTIQTIRCRQAIKRNLIDLAHAAIVALLIGLPFAAYFAFVLEA